MITRLQYPLLTLALVAFVWLGWRGRVPIGIGTLDENIYVALSKSLESGSYREYYLLSNPLHVKYPPGYPAFLAAVRLFGGENLDVVRAVNLVILAGSILLMFLIARRVANVGIALSLAFLMAINHVLLSSGGTVLSESLFIGLAAATLYLTLRADEGRDRLVYWAIAAAMLAFLTRTAGLALVTAVGIWLLGRRRRPELLAYVAASAVVVGGWLTYTALVPAQLGGTSYWLDVSGGLSRGDNPVLVLIKSVVRHFGFYAIRTVPGGLGVPTIEGTLIDNVVFLVINAVLILAGTLLLWKRARTVAAYLLVYGGLIVTWPWLQARVVMPIIPVAMTVLLLGAYQLSRRLSPVPRNAALAVLVLLLGVGGLQITLARDALVRKCDLARPYESEGCLDPVTRGIGRASFYIRDHTPPDAVVLSQKAPGVNYLSDRRTALPSVLAGVPEGKGLQRLRDLRIRYVLLSGQDGIMIWMARSLLPSCAELRVVRSFAPQVALLTTEAPAAASDNACPVLTELVNSRPGAY